MATAPMQSSDSYEIYMALAMQIKRHTLRFTLSPTFWDDLALGQTLTWYGVKFDSESASNVPNDMIGVYSFVVEPSIANHDLAYLLYIGMTNRQNFRARYRQYLGYQVEQNTQRPHVQYMLREWSNHLMFYYAPLEDAKTVKAAEDKLLEAFLPPIPRAFPASIRRSVSLSHVIGG